MTSELTFTDYLHLTKRIGAIAVSQLPVQYLMAVKPFSPLAWIFRSSHEEVSRFHRVLGRIIYGLLLSHMLLYINFFLQEGIFVKRILSPVVTCGVVASLGLHTLNATALVRMRAFSYRLFFVVHLVTALFLPVLIFFHAPQERLYLIEAVVLFLGNIIARRVTTVMAPTVVESIEGTNLLKVSATIPAKNVSKYQVYPGSHIYISIPPGARKHVSPAATSGVFDFLYNPFSVSSVNESEGNITLIARHRKGPLTDFLAQLALQSSGEGKPQLGIEGPYGSLAMHFNDLVAFRASRILLIAGGVGATFTVPLYRALQESTTASVQLVWAIRHAGEATWATSNEAAGKNLLEDPHVELFLTGDMGISENDAGDEDGVEMSSMLRDSRRGDRLTTEHNQKRPNIEKIVDDAFKQGLEDAVAVLVCGPPEMTREVRQRVRPWVMRGRKVWWHNESFDW